jgi:hypothetical protein
VRATKIAVALCSIGFSISCGGGELTRAKAKELLEQSSAFKQVLEIKPEVVRRVQRITGVRNEGKRAFADIEFTWDGGWGDVPAELLTANRTATARFSLYDDGWRYDGLDDEQSSTRLKDAAWVIHEYAAKGGAK